MIKPDSPQMIIQYGTFSCRITKAANTHTHTHTHTRARRICNTYCFSIATIVTRTRLNVKSFVHCLSCYNIKQFIVIPTRQNRTRSFTASRTPIFSSSVTSITWQYAKLYLPDSRGHGQCYVNRGLEEDLMMMSI